MTSINQKLDQYSYDPEGHIDKVRGFHQANFDCVSKSLLHASQQLKKSIASNSASVLTNTRLYSMLLSAWCEARLHVLLYEKGVFNEDQRTLVYTTNTVEGRWKKALHLAVTKNVDLEPSNEITEDNVGFSLFNIYNKVNLLIENYFSPVIRNRNKIAHAQWVTPFTNVKARDWKNSSSFQVCNTTKKDFENENLLTLENKSKLLKTIAVSINNIAVDSTVYKTQDFDCLYNQIRSHEKSIANIDFAKFERDVQAAYREQRL